MLGRFVSVGATVACALVGARAAVAQPLFIQDVQPPFGGMGDVITITGEGFGDVPDNICLLVMDQQVSIPMIVLDATPNMIIAEMGVVRPDVQPGPVMLALGEGFKDFFQPVFPDIIVEEPVWVWDFVEPFAEVAGPIFEPIPTDPNPEVKWFHSLPPEDGKMCIFIDGFWKPNSEIVLSGRVREHVFPFRGHDLFAVKIQLQQGGPALDCALRICDILKCAWEQILGDSDIECFAEPSGPNQAKITLTIPGGSIDWGNVDLCVSPPPNDAPPLIIDTVDPPFGGLGDVITITGAGFGDDPDDLCVLVMDGPVSIPMDVLAATDNEIKAQLGVVRPRAAPGPVMVAKGDGLRDVFQPIFPDIIVRNPVWAWDFTPPFVEVAGPIFEPFPTDPNPEFVWFHSDPPMDGKLCIYINGYWKPNSMITLSGRVREHNPPYRGHDMFAVDIMLTEGGPALHCAERICDVLRCTWEQLLGDSDIECFAEPVGPNEAKITLTIPDGSIDWGNVDLCVSPPPNPPCDADCNMDGQLNILDFVCFQQEWQNQTAYGDCNNDGAYNILDFVCYQVLWQAGCP